MIPYPITGRGSKVETLPNSDDLLSIRAFVIKYQLAFTKCFGPKYAYGVYNVNFFGPDGNLHVVARVKTVHQCTKGTITDFDVPMEKFRVWRKNVNLYTFVSGH